MSVVRVESEAKSEVRRGHARRWWLAAGLLLPVAGTALVLGLYLTVPTGNEGAGPVDVLMVLGTPAGMHGELTEMQRWRVDEAVREFRRGEAPRILFTGGPSSHGFVESDVMARYAIASGVPAEDVYRERRSLTTLENIRNSEPILKAHGWNRLEVISTREHLPRAAVLLEKTGLHWRTHPVPTPDRGWADTFLAFAEEAIGTAAIRVFGTGAEPVLHALARGQHGLGWSCRWVLYRVQDALWKLRDRWRQEEVPLARLAESRSLHFAPRAPVEMTNVFR